MQCKHTLAQPNLFYKEEKSGLLCDMEHLNRCFSSDEYKEIMSKRTESVDARALIVDNGD